MKTATLGEILTPAQLRRCQELYPDRQRIRDEVIIPNMSQINSKLGQENDPDYISWAIIYALGKGT